MGSWTLTLGRPGQQAQSAQCSTAEQASVIVAAWRPRGPPPLDGQPSTRSEGATEGSVPERMEKQTPIALWTRPPHRRTAQPQHIKASASRSPTGALPLGVCAEPITAWNRANSIGVGVRGGPTEPRDVWVLLTIGHPITADGFHSGRRPLRRWPCGCHRASTLASRRRMPETFRPARRMSRRPCRHVHSSRSERDSGSARRDLDPAQVSASFRASSP